MWRTGGLKLKNPSRGTCAGAGPEAVGRRGVIGIKFRVDWQSNRAQTE
jgi:hypothetical protein